MQDEPVKFDAEFIERRLREHDAWRQSQEAEMLREILEEIAAVIAPAHLC